MKKAENDAQNELGAHFEAQYDDIYDNTDVQIQLV